MPANDLVADGKRLAKVGLVVQVMVAAFLTGVTAVVATSNDAISTALGSASSIIPNAIFAFFAFRFAGAQQTQAVAKSMVQGARYKFLIVAVIFGIAFKGFNAQPLYLFCAFAVTTISYWATLFRLSKKLSCEP